MKFISMHCFNVNRPDPDELQPKKKKLDKTKSERSTKHDYPEIPFCDDVSYEQNLTKLSKELEKQILFMNPLLILCIRHFLIDGNGSSVKSILYPLCVKNFHF